MKANCVFSKNRDWGCVINEAPEQKVDVRLFCLEKSKNGGV